MSKKKSLQLPEYVHPLGVPFRVLLMHDPIDEEGSVGETAGELRIIKIAASQDTRRRWTTLLHEYIHAVLDVNGVASGLDPDMEEVIVQSLEHALEQFLLLNGNTLIDALEAQKKEES
jgi:Zn-dependent peptidase ImmA (M78 family)